MAAWLLRHLADEAARSDLQPHALQVEQTIDDLVIIANGRLVKEGDGGAVPDGGTLVRTSDSERLIGALRIADVTATAQEDHVVADTDDLRLVGDVALRAGLPVWELRTKRSDLEQLYFSLTEGTNRNLGDPAGSTPPPIDPTGAEQEGANR